MYEVNEPQIVSSCDQQKNNFSHESKHQSWHANLNKVINQKSSNYYYVILCYVITNR